RSDPFLWCGLIGDSTNPGSAVNGLKHGGIADPVTGCRWWLTARDHCRPSAPLRRSQRAGRKLRNYALAGDVCCGGTAGIGAGASRKIVVPQAVGKEPARRGGQHTAFHRFHLMEQFRIGNSIEPSSLVVTVRHPPPNRQFKT